MRKIQRLAAIGAMAAMTVALGACASSEAPSTDAPASAAPSASASESADASATDAAAGDGETTEADVFGEACPMLPQGDEPGSLTSMGPLPVAEAADSNPLLDTLVEAVGAAGLAETLNQQEAITVYAPVNDAFTAVQEALGQEAYDALLADPEALGALLQYHVVPERFDRDGLVEAGTTTQLMGGDVMITDAGETITLTDGMGGEATVLCGNIPTDNATVFAINAVLMPAAS